MKKIIYFVSLIAIFCSCSHDGELYSYETVNANLDKYLTDKAVSVTVPSGSIAVVRMGGDTLSITTESKDVIVPKYATPTIDYYSETASAATRATDPSYYNQLKNKANDNMWQVIAFEDSKNGDYDYNDLIVHNKYLISGNQLTIYIHPVALGAAKTINYGYELYKKDGDSYTKIGGDEISNVRKNLFLGSDPGGFINTEAYQRHYDGYTYSKTFTVSSNALSDYYIVSYITTDNSTDKIYAINKVNFKEADLFDVKGRPYALVLHGVSSNGYFQPNYSEQHGNVGFDWFQYPMERVSIDDCYDLSGWIQSSNTSNGSDCLDNFKKSGANVFNVVDRSRYHADGKTEAGVYELASPLPKVSDWQ